MSNPFQLREGNGRFSATGGNQENLLLRGQLQEKLRDCLNAQSYGPIADRAKRVITLDEFQWCMRVCDEQPEWAISTLRSHGIPPKSST
jgi:hypothetical protein